MLLLPSISGANKTPIRYTIFPAAVMIKSISAS